jgi:stage III sporulation protein AD
LEIAQIVGLALVTTIMLLILRQEKPVMAIILSIHAVLAYTII